MTKVALIRASSNLVNDISIDEHLGLGYLAATLDVNKCGISRIFEESVYDAAHLSMDSEIEEFAPDVLAFTVDYTNVTRTRKVQAYLCSLINRNKAKPICVWGGHHASLCAREIINQHQADYVVAGNAEVSFCELVSQIATGCRPKKRLYISSNHQYWLKKHSSEQLSVKLPTRPRRDTLRVLHQNRLTKAARIVTSRGCPFSCKFCTTPSLRRMGLLPRLEVRSPEDVVQEIMELKYELGIRSFYINDDIFIDGSKQSKIRAKCLAELMLDQGLDVTFKTQLRVDSLSPDRDTNLLLYLREAGMARVFLGVENGVNEVLEELGKKTTAAQNLYAIDWYETNGIHVTPGRILFMPNTTWNDLRVTLNLFSRCQKAFYLLRRPNFRLMIFPGTEMYNDLMKKGKIKQGNHLFQVDYLFEHFSIFSFCSALENLYPDFIAVAGLLFHLLSMQFLPNFPDKFSVRNIAEVRLACEKATQDFMLANIDLADSWSISVFNDAAAIYLERLRALVNSIRPNENPVFTSLSRFIYAETS
jgi:anaerobic magnesium-protoporphyrin IX monomethyl ester cyclase